MKSKNSGDSRKPAKKSVKAAAPKIAKTDLKATSAAQAKAPAPPVKAPAPVPPPVVKPAAPAPPPRPRAKRTLSKVPPILLEDDRPSPTPTSGPGQRYALGPVPAVASSRLIGGIAELPESYGTGELLIAARDPHWLYAHWDFNIEDIRKHNRLSAMGHLMLRVYRGAIGSEMISEIHLHPESRNWFIPVPHGGAKYQAELGYRDKGHHWVSLARSQATVTPPEGMSPDTSVTFATIPPEIPFEELMRTVKNALRLHAPLVEALQQLRAQGFTSLPAPEEIKSDWSPAQQEAVANVVAMDSMRRVWIGSVEITELVRRQLQEQVSSLTAAQWGSASSEARISSEAMSITSAAKPFGEAEQPRGFWFNINAEVIIYGATEPDAKVQIGDRPIRLRPDGSFSFRFALPDGKFSMPAIARSADSDETREAHLKFARDTSYEGDVGRHPQDKNLKAPSPEAVS